MINQKQNAGGVSDGGVLSQKHLNDAHLGRGYHDTEPVHDQDQVLHQVVQEKEADDNVSWRWFPVEKECDYLIYFIITQFTVQYYFNLNFESASSINI